MGLAWQQGPLAAGAVGKFLSADPVPERMLFVEPLRRRMSVEFGGQRIASSDHVLLLHEPGKYPVALFPREDVDRSVVTDEARTTTHRDLGATSWFTVRVGDRVAPHAAWTYADAPRWARDVEGRIAFAWRLMDAFFEEDERIVGHAADFYHRTDIRQTSRHLVVKDGEKIIADTHRPLAVYETGFAPRWYVPRDDIDAGALTSVGDVTTFCPYKGLASYYDIGEHKGAAWSYRDAWPAVDRISDWVSFEPDRIDVYVDGERLMLEPGQKVSPHGVDRDLDPREMTYRTGRAAASVTTKN